MKKKLVREFLAITFSVMLIFWGSACLICRGTGLTVTHPLIRIMHVLGGFSPTLASYISLKRQGDVKGPGDWFRQVFDFRAGLLSYVAIPLFLLIYFGTGGLPSGFREGAPWSILPLLLLVTLVGGGNEEPGWRMVLQKELEKEYGFHRATLTVAGIWWLWHLPLFFLPGTANSSMNYFFFGIACLTLSYALATIRTLSQKVFPCILFHCLVNSLSSILLFSLSLRASLACLIATVLLSMFFMRRLWYNEKHDCRERQQT